MDRSAEPGRGAPIDGEGLRLRVYSIRSFLLSLRGRKAPSFTARTPPPPQTLSVRLRLKGPGWGL